MLAHSFRFGILAFSLCDPAFATTSVCDDAALRASDRYGVPQNVMLAIARVESGRSQPQGTEPWPWAVNQAGNPHWFESPQDAIGFVETAISDGLSNIDIGCFQLNLKWHGAQFSSLEDMFDPYLNADYAARFLLQNHQRKGNWVDAVAAYHSSTSEHAEAYIEKVEAVLQDIVADRPESAERVPSSPELPRENSFPLLKPGSAGSLASLMPSGDGATPLFVPMP